MYILINALDIILNELKLYILKKQICEETMDILSGISVNTMTKFR